MNFDDLKIYLPKYLSTESAEELYESLRDFPQNIDQRIYTTYLKEEPVIFQGDGLDNLIVVNLPEVEKKNVPAMIISNTCDIDPNNARNFPSQIIYTPFINFAKYSDMLKKDSSKSIEQIEGHLNSIKKQHITQIFYLPPINDVFEESIVFLDRVFNIGSGFVDRKRVKDIRLFTLSDYGNYLFLFKLSLHFTRIQDKVERKSLI